MSEQTQNSGLPSANPKTKAFFSVDLVRSLAIFLVILLHVAIEPVSAPPQINPTTAWWAFDFYNTIARPCVPLFVMLSGYLLLQPSKVNEPLKAFFKKRWARIGLPFIFWGAIYIVWVGLFDGGSFSAASIEQSLLQGPFVTFWFLYMLVGLYLLTPLLRVFTAHASDNLMKYVLVIWFIGTGLIPLANLLGYSLSSFIFILPGWIGYYLLGSYLPKIKLKIGRWKLLGLMLIGYIWTGVASAFMMINPGSQIYFFFDYLTANVIIASVALFLLLISVSNTFIETKMSKAMPLIHTISENTLPIFLFHMILLEAFEKGLFGFTLNIMVISPVIMTPLLAILVLFLSLGVILALKKIPILTRLIG
jgi:surface polysaccharide O-acyltransferase-like enzyme